MGSMGSYVDKILTDYHSLVSKTHYLHETVNNAKQLCKDGEYKESVCVVQ